MGKKRNFSGKHVVITGGSEGIGLELAKNFRRRGSNVTVISRSEDKLRAAVNVLEGLRPAANSDAKVQYATADVAVYKEVEKALTSASSGLGPIDVLICNAGLSIPGLFLEQDVAVSSQTMQVNYIGTVNTIKVLLPDMVKRRSGYITIVASAAAVIGFGGYSSYAPSKWALRGLADCLRNEMVGTGVAFSVAYPPDTLTPGYAREQQREVKLLEDLNKAMDNKVYPADKVVECMVWGMERERYHLPSPDFMQNLLLDSMTGMTPGRWPLLRCLMAPILVLASWLTVRDMDGVTRKANAKQLAEVAKVGHGGSGVDGVAVEGRSKDE